MTMDEVIKMARKEFAEQASVYSSGIGLAIAGKLISDAIDRVAIEQGKMADVQVKQWELAKSMMNKAGPLMDKTLDVMNRETQGEEWKNQEIEEDTSDHESNS